MSKFLIVIMSVIALVSGSAHAQATVDVYHTGITNSITGLVVSSGQECITPVDGQGNPTPGNYPGGTFTKAKVCHAITNGTVAPFYGVVRSDFANPGVCYALTINDTGRNNEQVVKKGDGFDCIKLNTVSIGAAQGGSINLNTIAPYHSSFQLPQQGQKGDKGETGATGCLASNAGCTNLVPQSITGRLFPTAFYSPGDTLKTMVDKALASTGGTSSSHIDRVTIELPFGMNFVTPTVELPNGSGPPYVNKVDFICHSNTIVSNDPTKPTIHVAAFNSNGGQNTGSITGCTFPVSTNAGVPAVQVDARIAFEISQNTFVGGDVSLRETNTTFNDGFPGYNEQHWIHNNDFENMTSYGVDFTTTTGTDSFLYGSVDWTNHFQLMCGAAAIHIGPGITIQGGELSGRINTTSSTCATSTTVASAIRNDSTGSGKGVYRGSVGQWSGEDTGGLGLSHLVLFDGPGSTILIDHGTIVGGMSLKSTTASLYSHLSLPYNLRTDSFGTDYCAVLDSESIGAGSLLSRKPITAMCENSFRMYSGAEGSWGDMGQYYYSGADPQHMGTVISAWRSFPTAFTFGSGYTPRFSDGSCPDPAGCNIPTSPMEGRSLTIRIPGQTDGLMEHAESDGVHLTMNKSNTPVGQPTAWLTFDAYDTSGGTYMVKPMLKVRFENGAPVWYFPGLTGSGCAAMVVRADGSIVRGAAVTCP